LSMQSLRLNLIRHGHVDYFDADQQPINPKYAPLSAQAEQQIELLATHLQPIQLDQIFSSTMPRSIKTAELLTRQQPRRGIDSYDAIREIKSGRLKDIPVDQAEVLIKKAYYPKKFALNDFLQGESWVNFEARVIGWLQQMLMQESQSKPQQSKQHILVSAHDAVNRIILNWVQGLHNHDVQEQEQ